MAQFTPAVPRPRFSSVPSMCPCAFRSRGSASAQWPVFASATPRCAMAGREAGPSAAIPRLSARNARMEILHMIVILSRKRKGPRHRRGPQFNHLSEIGASEMVFQGELNVSGALGALQQSQSRAQSSVRRIQDRRIRKVNAFGSELEALMFGDIEEFRQ